jgi:alkylation response protein AidB-like acyl-CoA dehydrogenase
MDLQDTREQAKFRAAVRAWLDDNAAEAPARTVLAPQDEASVGSWRQWQARLADAGYAGVTWPEEHGGAGLGPVERVIVDQELEARGVQGVFDFIGVEMVGPTLIERASAAQCERRLRPLLRGDEVWCQLFSEPGAGSDLANVQTKARRTDEGWLVNGQKVWTTNAQHAAFGIMLARTDPEAPRHKGLTMFIVPMDTPGITIRPLRQITGDAEFNEVFFDDVVLAEHAVIGEPGEGWSVALTMLGFERLVVGSGLHTVRLDRLAGLVGSSEAQDDPSVRVRLGKVAAELLSLRYSNYRLLTDIEQGRVPGPEAGMVKITTVLASFDACRLAADVGGPEALVDDEWGHQISALPGLRSAGGTEEILRNVIGERVLGLPAEPKVPAPERKREPALAGGNGGAA